MPRKEWCGSGDEWKGGGGGARSNVNEHLTRPFALLRDLCSMTPGDENHWRAYTYGKVVNALSHWPERIRTMADAR